MKRVPWTTLALLALLSLPASAWAGMRIADMGGHLSIGYGKLLLSTRPGGSMSMATGLDYPVARQLRAGIDVGYDLYGGRTVQEGSLFGSVDYSAFHATAFLHWLPERLGPVRRISLGPALVTAHGDLSVTGGGASFSYLGVSETAAAVEAQVTLMQAKPALLKLGLELAARRAFLPGDDWPSFAARATVHY